jgi:hypothetical protein
MLGYGQDSLGREVKVLAGGGNVAVRTAVWCPVIRGMAFRLGAVTVARPAFLVLGRKCGRDTTVQGTVK